MVDKIALWQIWATLRPLHKMSFLALAAHNDCTKAAQAVDYPYSTFAYLISQAPTSTTGSPLCSVTPAAQMAMSLTVRELLSRPGQAAGQRVE